MLWHDEGCAPGGFSVCVLKGRPWAACLGISWKTLDTTSSFKGLTPICRRPLTEVGRRGLGGCWRVQISSKMVPTWLQNGSKIDLGASWRALGVVLAAWSALGGLLERCWSALGGLRGRKKDLLSGSWAFQEESQDRFQPSWRPKGSQTGAQKGAKTRSKSDSSSKV